jgi:hypothetical protein
MSLSAEDRGKRAAGLRAMATFIETTELPLSGWSDMEFVEFGSWMQGNDDNPPEPGEIARLMAHHGRVEKRTQGDSWYVLELQFAEGVKFSVTFSRDAVCIAKVVGTKPVIERTYTDEARAKELQEQLAAMEVEKIVGHEDLIEYECPPSLLAGKAEAA